jgi:hypothetical protein
MWEAPKVSMEIKKMSSLFGGGNCLKNIGFEATKGFSAPLVIDTLWPGKKSLSNRISFNPLFIV